MFPVKNKSGYPSLLKSDTAIPPPLKIYSSLRILNSSVSFITLLKSIPVSFDFNSSNRYLLLVQDWISTTVSIIKIFPFIYQKKTAE